jgi:hypothetical protein
MNMLVEAVEKIEASVSIVQVLSWEADNRYLVNPLEPSGNYMYHPL